ncbi:TcfC E-set like domain-containing protein [Shewanella sp. MTB7]|uniref:TcfC E-set like domain-containing protein n=1 Tax=Shewanella sp. MTB7 TaxID=2746932 RepID=UPI0022BA6EC0|nr:TcfC E-set like domain-containing protein [Shewanella sp. MTB7]WBJ97154.1 TcfC E-set like domain-containing protein [Shewanella sp. MTB7]
MNKKILLILVVMSQSSFPQALAGKINGSPLALNKSVVSALTDNNRYTNIKLSKQLNTQLNSISLLTTSSNKVGNYNRLLAFKPRIINVIIVGSEETIKPLTIDAEVSFYAAVINDTQTVYNHFIHAGLSPEGAQRIADELHVGVTHSESCMGERSECKLPNDQLRFVNDYYGKTLRVFIPTSLFTQQSYEPRFLNSNATNQIVSNIYANYDNSFTESYFANLNNYIGIGRGYARVDARINQYEPKLTRAEYIYDFDRYTATIGLSESLDSQSLASQSSLLSGGEFTGVSLAKTNNLLVNTQREQQIIFYSPSSGLLEVLRNGEVLYQQFVNAGRGQINYAVLPVGSYNVDVVIKDNDTVVYNSKEFIYNLNLKNSQAFSPYARVGSFSQNESNFTLFEAGASWPITNHINMIANGYLLDNRAGYSLGANYQYENFSSRLKFSMTDNAYQTEFDVNYGYLNFRLTDNRGFNDTTTDNNQVNEAIGLRDGLMGNLSLNYPISSTLSIYGNGFYSTSPLQDNAVYSGSIGLNYQHSSAISGSVSYEASNIIIINLQSISVFHLPAS